MCLISSGAILSSCTHHRKLRCRSKSREVSFVQESSLTRGYVTSVVGALRATSAVGALRTTSTASGTSTASAAIVGSIAAASGFSLIIAGLLKAEETGVFRLGDSSIVNVAVLNHGVDLGLLLYLDIDREQLARLLVLGVVVVTARCLGNVRLFRLLSQVVSVSLPLNVFFSLDHRAVVETVFLLVLAIVFLAFATLFFPGIFSVAISLGSVLGNLCLITIKFMQGLDYAGNSRAIWPCLPYL